VGKCVDCLVCFVIPYQETNWKGARFVLLHSPSRY
jgi:hypothetical protein